MCEVRTQNLLLLCIGLTHTTLRRQFALDHLGSQTLACCLLHLLDVANLALLCCLAGNARCLSSGHQRCRHVGSVLWLSSSWPLSLLVLTVRSLLVQQTLAQLTLLLAARAYLLPDDELPSQCQLSQDGKRCYVRLRSAHYRPATVPMPFLLELDQVAPLSSHLRRLRRLLHHFRHQEEEDLQDPDQSCLVSEGEQLVSIDPASLTLKTHIADSTH